LLPDEPIIIQQKLKIKEKKKSQFYFILLL